jgi:hypothetical protein
MINEAMKPSRRGMLVGLSASVASLGAVAASALTLDFTGSTTNTGSWWDQLFVSLKHGGYDEWLPLVGSSFLLAGRQGNTELNLVEVRPLDRGGRRPASLGRDRAFAAIFESAGPAPSGDRIYTAKHADYGALDIFMSLGTGGRVGRVVAVFN